MKRAVYATAVILAFFVLTPGLAFGAGQQAEEQSVDVSDIELGQDGPVEIDFWHIQATIYGDAVQDIVSEFNEEYDGRIRVNEVFQGSYGDLNKKIRAAIQGGGLPNVSMAYENDTLEYMRADVIQPLDDYLNNDRYGLEAGDREDIMAGVLARQEIEQYDGKTMSWPHGNSSMGIYYNKDLLQEAGYERPEETWDAFIEQSLAITEATGVPAVTVDSDDLNSRFLFWLRTFGVEPISADGQSVNLDSEESIELLNSLKTLYDAGAFDFVENVEQEFTNGRSVFEMGTTARTSSKLDLIQGSFEWGITLIPQGDRSSLSTALWGGNHVMFRSSPEEQLASWIFMDYFADRYAQAIYGAQTGYFPARGSSQDVPILEANYSSNPQKQQAFEEVFPHARILTPTPGNRLIQDRVGETVTSFLTGGTMSAEQAASRMQQQAENALAQY
ncbi:MAG: extracellular solute-binding protein [Spirochaetes bacterium]|jgi:ABC-type glycerol-3-phosphate transport system substrate-binding protein|nr:extracellular solute-binding protein [Spirochaetota bacterium]